MKLEQNPLRMKNVIACQTDRANTIGLPQTIVSGALIKSLNQTNQNFNPLLDMPILGSSNSATNKDIMSKI